MAPAKKPLKAPPRPSPYPGPRRPWRRVRAILGYLGDKVTAGLIGAVIGALVAYGWTQATAPESINDVLTELRREAQASRRSLTILADGVQLRPGLSRATVVLLSPDLRSIAAHDDGALLGQSDEIRIYETEEDDTRLSFSFQPKEGTLAAGTRGLFYRMTRVVEHPGQSSATLWGAFFDVSTNHGWAIPVHIEWNANTGEYDLQGLAGTAPHLPPLLDRDSWAAGVRRIYSARVGLRDAKTGRTAVGHRVEDFTVTPDVGRGEGVILVYIAEQEVHAFGPDVGAVEGWNLYRESQFRSPSRCLSWREKSVSFAVRSPEQFGREAEAAWRARSPRCP